MDIEYLKEKIIEKIKEIDNLRYLEFIHELLISFKKKCGI